MCSDEEYKNWESGKVLFNKDSDSFCTREDAIEKLKISTHWRTNELRYPDTNWEDEETANDILRDNYYCTEEQYWDSVDYETFSDSYKTPNGETVHAFGYYGTDN
jgi:hypothetical protein